MKDNLGPTGKFPEGKITKGDQGELKMAIGIYKNTVIIDFGTKISWLGLPKQEAIAFAELIIKNANKL